MWLVHASTIETIARFLTADELREEPHDLVANYVVRAAHHFSTTGGRALVAAYLLVHGAVKIALVVALLRKKRWAYPAFLAALSLFILLQGYRMIFSPTVSLALLTLFDGVIAWLVWREYRRIRHARAAGIVRSVQ